MIVDPDFLDHWKTRTLVTLLDGDENAPLMLLRLWAHCQMRRTSVFEGLPPAALAGICRYSGPPAKLVDALVESRWIDREGDEIKVRKWEDYNASLLSAWGNGKRGGRKPKVNPPVTHGLTQGKPTGNPWVNPSHSKANPRVAHGGPNKRRVDRIGEEERGAEPAAPPPSPEPRPDLPDPISDHPPHEPTLAEVLKKFAGQEIPEDYLREQFEKMDANREWWTRDRRELRKWDKVIRGRWVQDQHDWKKRRENAASHPSGGGGKQPAWRIRQDLQEALARHRANPDSAFYASNHTPAEAAACNDLKRRLKQLSRELAEVDA